MLGPASRPVDLPAYSRRCGFGESRRPQEADVEFTDSFTPAEWESLTGNRATRDHSVTIEYPPGHYAGNDDRYELDCDSCGYVGATDTLAQAEAVARLHEEFVATLVTSFEIPA